VAENQNYPNGLENNYCLGCGRRGNLAPVLLHRAGSSHGDAGKLFHWRIGAYTIATKLFFHADGFFTRLPLEILHALGGLIGGPLEIYTAWAVGQLPMENSSTGWGLYD